MKKTVFLMAMMSAVALVSVSCRNGGDDKNEKSTEIPVRKKILGKWYPKSLIMVSGNPVTPPDAPEYFDENECEKQSYLDFGAERSGIITLHEFENQNEKCVESIRRAEYSLNEKGTEMKYRELEEDNLEWESRVVKQITDKILVLEWKEDGNKDGVEDIYTYTLYRK